MTQRQSFATLVVAAAVAVAIIASATALVALHDLDPASYTALVATALTATGLGGIQLGQKAINGGPTVDLERLSKVSPDVAHTLAQQTEPPAVAPTMPPGGAQ